MTEELKAEEWSEKHWSNPELTRKNLAYQAYLAGLHEGKLKWHDLRKDPNDLPKNDKNYLIITDDGKRYIAKHFHNDNYWVCKVNIYVSFIKHVIAWCDPQFKE